jgi:hypothetical protein
MLNLAYNVKSIQAISDHLLTETIDEILKDNFEPVEKDEFYYAFPILSIAALTQTSFKKVDKEFHRFGKIFLETIRKYEAHATAYEIQLILDSFSKLVLNNLGFANSVLFPDVDIQSIGSKLQVELVIKGKYFRLLPDLLSKCKDVQFHFK